MSVTQSRVQVEVLPVVRRYEPGNQPREELIRRQLEDPPGIDPLLAGIRRTEAVVVDRVTRLAAPATHSTESRTDVGITLSLLDDATQLIGCQHRAPRRR